jgi:hypothetical protein
VRNGDMIVLESFLMIIPLDGKVSTDGIRHDLGLCLMQDT